MDESKAADPSKTNASYDAGHGAESSDQSSNTKQSNTRPATQRWGYRAAQVAFAGAACLALNDKRYKASTTMLGGVLAAEVMHDLLDGLHEPTYPVRIRHDITDKSAMYMGAGLAGAGDGIGMGLAFAGSSSPNPDRKRQGSFGWGMKKARPFSVSILSPLIGGKAFS
jgi:hypothetical protein